MARLRDRLAKASRRDPNVWVTKDGVVTPIRVMADQHLLNTIVMLNRRAMKYIAEHGRRIENRAPPSDDRALRG